MESNRIVTELYLEKSNYKEVSKLAKALKSEGVTPIVLPPEDREITTHIVVENSDLETVRKTLKKMNTPAVEKEVILITLENRPGTMAESAKRISDKGINLLYAFSVAMTPTLSYVLLGTADNEGALRALESP